MNVTIGGIARTVEITSFDKLGDVKVCMLTTTADGSVGFEQLNDEVRDTIYASFPVDTASGEIASFEDGADNVPVRELKLNLEPYQNLNGYDSPWVGGGNGNYLPNNATDGTTTLNGITLKEANGVYSLSGTASAETTFNISLSASVDLSPSTNKICFLNSASYSAISVGFTRSGTRIHYWSITPSNRVISGWTDSGNEVIDGVRIVIANGTAISETLTISPMLVKATDTSPTSFTPYSNICPIYPANGKNLYDSATREDGYISATGVVTVDGSSVHSALIPVTPNQPIVFSGLTVGSGGGSTKRLHGYNSSGTWVQQLGYASNVQDGTRYTISATVPSGITGVKISFRGTDEQVQVEHGISPSTYVPYNAIGITRTGKNLFDKNAVEAGVYLDTVTGLPISASAYSVSDFIPVEEGVSVFIPASQSTRRWFYTKDRTPKTFLNNSNNQVYTPTENGYIRVSISHNAIPLDTYQIEYGTGATSYEPYQCERYYPISDNPVYGGTLDVTTGVLTVDTGYYELPSTLDWAISSVRVGRYYIKNATLNIGANPFGRLICNQAKGVQVSTTVLGECYLDTNGQYAVNTSYSTVADFKQSIVGNPITIAYELASPLVYQLTPVQVKTLLGYNNIWTDSGSVEVQYLANIGLYIQKIIGVTEDDMVANQNISANKYFFVGEELYYSTSAISAGQTIIVGTNCIKTNLADALNALNS